MRLDIAMREIIRLKNLDKIVCDRVVGFNSIKTLLVNTLTTSEEKW